ncbi:hypothetical protein Tco_0524703 [Tanacetum coccineum]
MAWFTTQWKWLADVVPEDCIIHLIGEKFVALFHLELEMNHVRMKHFNDFKCWAFQSRGVVVCCYVRSDDGIVQAGSGVAGLSSVRGFHQLLPQVDCILGAMLIDYLPDEWMRMEVVEEELEQNRRIRLCHNPLMRLTVVEEEVVVKVETQAEYLGIFALLFFLVYSLSPVINISPHFITTDESYSDYVLLGWLAYYFVIVLLQHALKQNFLHV